VSTEAGFLAAIAAEPDDDTHRLVFADWLEENGQLEKAEFIRVQCELEPIREDHDSERANALRKREEELGPLHITKLWGKEFQGRLAERSRWIDVVFRRGLPESLALPVQWFLEEGETVRNAYPTVQRMDLFRVAGWGARLAASPHLEGLRELEIACWTTKADLEALADSLYLSHLRMLRVWLAPGARDEATSQAVERCARLPSLREVQVVWGDPTRFEPHPGLPVIRCIDPTDRTYALAPGGSGYFDAYFPGKLPDGTQVFGQMPRPKSNQMPLLLFDPQGNQIEQRLLELPPHLVPEHGEYEGGTGGLERWRQLEKDIAAHLVATLGHRPCLIRVKGLEFPDEWGPSLEDWTQFREDELGALDDPELAPEDDQDRGPPGYGGSFHSGLHRRQFVFWHGNDWWVDGITGHVTST
jgi:uncharacterized protein (TIGR02996 family)